MGVECNGSDNMRILVKVWRRKLYLSDLVLEACQCRFERMNFVMIVIEPRIIQIGWRELPYAFADYDER